MRSHAVLSVAFVAAAIAPQVVMSLPIADSQVTQPSMVSVPNMNQTAPTDHADSNLVDGFLSSLSADQLQDLKDIVQKTSIGSGPAASPMQTTSSNQDDMNRPKERSLPFGSLMSIAAKGATNVGDRIAKDIEKKLPKREVEPTPTTASHSTQDDMDQPEKRFSGPLFGTAAKGGFSLGAKIAKDIEKILTKRAVEPTPTTASHSIQDDMDQPEKRFLDPLFGTAAKTGFSLGAKIAKDIEKKLTKRAVEPTPIAIVEGEWSTPINHPQGVPIEVEKRQLESLLGALLNHGSGGASEIGSIIQSILKREVEPTPKAAADRIGWTPPPIPTPPPVPSCWYTGSCGGVNDLD